MRALLAGAAAALAFAPSALAGEQTLTFTTGPIVVDAYGVATAPAAAQSPQVDGYVVGMTAEVVDAAGRVQGRDKVMLHHIVFGKVDARDATCPGSPERFYAEGEERLALKLPQGYGYPNRATDRWYLLYMLMNHKPRQLTGYIRYRVRYVTGAQLTPVRPIWLDVANCKGLDPVYDVPGGGKRFSTHRKRYDWVASESGRIVAGGAHLHGGGIQAELRNETCGASLFTSRPTWGGPKPKPLLHEPGPTKMSQFTSDPGIPVAAGQKLRLVATYENSRPHTRAMGIFIFYLAPGAVSGCGPVPRFDVDLGRPSLPPPFSMPLPRRPEGPVRRDLTGTVVGDFAYGAERVSIRRGTTFTWKFAGGFQHDVTLVSGPVGFSAPWTLNGEYRHTFTKRGTYNLFCSLHPARMVQQVVVR
jgi:hypothetical protein